MDYQSIWAAVSPYIIAHCPWVIPLFAVMIGIGAVLRGVGSLRRPDTGQSDTLEHLLESAIRRVDNTEAALERERKRNAELSDQLDSTRRQLEISDQWIGVKKPEDG